MDDTETIWVEDKLKIDVCLPKKNSIKNLEFWNCCHHYLLLYRPGKMLDLI